MDRSDRLMTRTTLALGAILLLTALFGVWVSAIAGERPNWFALGFELVILVSAVFAVLTGLGHFRAGRPAALGTLAGVVGSAALLGYIASRGSGVVGNLPVKEVALLRFALAGALGICAGLDAVRHNLRVGAVSLAWSIGLGGAGLALLGSGWIARDWVASQGNVTRISIVLVGFALVTGLLAASAEKMAHALRVGRDAPDHQPKV